MRSPTMVCLCRNARSEASSGPALSRISSGIAIFPMSCNIAARPSSSSSLSVRPRSLPDGDRELGDAVGVAVELGLALVEGAEERLVRIFPRRLASPLLDVEALVRLAERPCRVRRLLGEQDGAEGARHGEPLAVLAERLERVVEQAASQRRVGGSEQAELVAAEPIAASVAGGGLGQLLAETFEQGIAGRVAERVVVSLESVEVVDREEPGLARPWRRSSRRRGRSSAGVGSRGR